MSSTAPNEMEVSIEEALSLLKGLSHKGRLQVLCALGQKELNAGQLAKLTGLSPSALAQHLGPLQREGFLTVRKEGTFRYYKLASQQAKEVIKVLKRLYCKNESR